MAALIDDESLAELCHIDLIGAQQIDEFDFAFALRRREELSATSRPACPCPAGTKPRSSAPQRAKPPYAAHCRKPFQPPSASVCLRADHAGVAPASFAASAKGLPRRQRAPPRRGRSMIGRTLGVLENFRRRRSCPKQYRPERSRKVASQLLRRIVVRSAGGADIGGRADCCCKPQLLPQSRIQDRRLRVPGCSRPAAPPSAASSPGECVLKR